MRTTLVSLAIVLALAMPAAAQPVPTQRGAPQPESSNCPHVTAGSAVPTPALMAARQTERQACAADLRQFCANVPRGCGRPMQCLRAHAVELSAGCTAAMAQLRAARVQSHQSMRGNPGSPSPLGR